MVSYRYCQRVVTLILFITTLGFNLTIDALTADARNDPVPVYTTLDPQNYLYMHDRMILKGMKPQTEKAPFVGLSISPFAENADRARDMDNNVIPIGDIYGRWNMLALLFGPLPEGKVLPPTLQTAKDVLFPTQPAGVPIDGNQLVDPNHEFGFFSVPVKYRKRGLRTQILGQVLCDFGICFQGGVSDICQTVTGFTNLTCDATLDCPIDLKLGQDPLTKDNVNEYLMCELTDIADETGLNICNFHKFSLEDIRLSMYWRHGYSLNKQSPDWPVVLIIPFFELGGSLATASYKRDPNTAFALSFGSNDHNAVGFIAGLDFDFAQTIEIGSHFGMTHFFAKDFNKFRVPNDESQSGIYPFTTDVTINPGHNWEFGLKLSAYHFLENLSFYFQYFLMHHDNDSIKLKCCDDAFQPKVLEKISDWKVQVANMAFNYDISPHVSLGFLWQAPLARRGAYKTTTLMFSFNALF